ncbi:MAG: SemiSWEET family transporter [bacterium]
MNYITFIGLAAGFLTTFSFSAQIIKTWKTKETKDLSLITFSLQLIAVILWTSYGLILRELPLILWNTLTAILVLMIVIFKLKYK